MANPPELPVQEEAPKKREPFSSLIAIKNVVKSVVGVVIIHLFTSVFLSMLVGSLLWLIMACAPAFAPGWEAPSLWNRFPSKFRDAHLIDKVYYILFYPGLGVDVLWVGYMLVWMVRIRIRKTWKSGGEKKVLAHLGPLDMPSDFINVVPGWKPLVLYYAWGWEAGCRSSIRLHKAIDEFARGPKQ